MDEQLPRLLAEVAESGSGEVLAAPVLDVDHFKQVNDAFSHDVGDEVLRRLAALLSAAAGPVAAQGFAARLGGEEFVLVRCGLAADDAACAVDRLRAAVEAADWADVAPGLRVTLSAGLAFGRPDDIQRSMLRRADGHLYDAKSAGRNRVLSDPLPGSRHDPRPVQDR